jgi:beta-galactosidase
VPQPQANSTKTLKPLIADKFRLGACYYPEQWPESLWDEDFRRMTEMGLCVVRMAEFGWTIMEPEPGRFEFELFERAMDLASEHGMKVILGTPTATPPAWLTHEYPEVLNASREGVVFGHGQRRHYNYNAPVYRELSERIAGKMAEHYHRHPALLGWQIDNEINCEIAEFYSEADHNAFREWALGRYGTLDRLNEAWGAVFWSQTYTDWCQVRLSGPTPTGSPNPHQMLDEKRFFSDSAVSFVKLQAEAIRAFDRDHFITTQGLFAHLDSHDLARGLDFVSYDSYPGFSFLFPDPVDAQGKEEPLLDRRLGFEFAKLRDVSPNFCVMEQQSGPGGWVNRIQLPTPKPGQMRLWTYQSIAHGADMVLYFRWRTAPFGTEIYWYGINDHDNQPNRRCREAQRVAEEVNKLTGIEGSRYVADVAILTDYDNEWDGEFDASHGPLQRQSEQAWFATLQHRHVPVDVVYLRDGMTPQELARYRCLIYPHASILPDSTARLLDAYTEAGGTLVFGCRTGYKDRNGHCPMRPYPGPVAELCGITVDEFSLILPGETQPMVFFQEAGSLPSGPFNEVLRPGRAQVLAKYKEDAGHYRGRAALTWNHWGEGSAFYYGGVFTRAVANVLAERIGLDSPMAFRLALPKEVELAIREREDGSRFVFLLNYTGDPVHVEFKEEAHDRLRSRRLLGLVEMEAYGVLILDL